MPDEATISVLRDLAVLTWLALMIGVLVYRGIERLRPAGSPPRIRKGKVACDVFAAPDGIVVAGVSMILLYGLNAGAAAGAPGVVDEGSAPAELTLDALLMNAVFMLLLGAIVVGYLSGIRRLDVVAVFGLKRLSAARVLGLGLLLLIPIVVTVNASAYAVNLWLEGIWGGMEPQNTVQAFQDSDGWAMRVIMVAFAVVIAPVVEETLFRGLIYPVFKKYTDGIFAAACSSVLFGLVHMHVGSLAPLVILALILCFVYERTGSLWLPMVIHAGFNGVSLLALSTMKEGM